MGNSGVFEEKKQIRALSKSKVFLLALMSFTGGVILYSFAKIPPFILSGVFIFGLAFLARDLWRFNSELRRERLFGIVFASLIFVFALGLWRSHQVFSKEGRLPESTVGQDARVFTGRIIDEPDWRSGFVYYKVDVSGIGKVLVKTGLYPEYSYGDVLKIYGRIQKPENFGDFDYRNYLAKEDIFWTSQYPKIDLIEKRGSDLFGYLLRLKAAFIRTVNRILIEPQASLLNALLLGARRALPGDLVEALNKTGTSHIVAISGYNISLISVMLFNFFTYLLMPRRVSFWIVGAVLLIFTLISGAQASVVRAAVMGSLLLIAQRKDRSYQVTNALVFAATMMLVFNPRLIRYDAGFQLSFLATLGLIYLAPYFQIWFSKVPDFLSLRSNLAATLSAQIATLPVVLLNFGRVSLISPLANILILPAVPAAMLFGFLAGIAGFISFSAGLFLVLPAWFLVSYVIWIVKILS